MEDNRQKYDRSFTQLLGLGVIEDLTGESLAEARLLIPFYFLFSFTEMPHLASGQVDLGRSVKNGYTQLLFLSIFSPFLHTQSSARAHTHTYTCTGPCTDRLTHQPLLPSRTCAVHKQHMIYGPACNKNMIYDFCNCFRDFAWMLLTTHQENSLEDENKLGLLGLQRDFI